MIGEKKKLPESYMSCEAIIRDCYKGMELITVSTSRTRDRERDGKRKGEALWTKFFIGIASPNQTDFCSVLEAGIQSS